MIIVTFNFHSCFTVELDNYVLVFDYYEPNELNDKLELPKNKKLVFFASHRHGDHFSKDIFKFKNEYEDITFILSDDIWMKNSGEPIDFVGVNKSYSINGIEITTLKSTDEGVAFVINVDGKSIYYAGDLHWWYWEEKGEDYIKLWGDKYKKEIEKIKDKDFDLSFVVLDPRMGIGYGAGLMEYLKTVKSPGVVFPMHLWGQYDLIEKFKNIEEAKAYKDRIMDILKPRQEFIIEE